jgi:CheY-like chemotaxis protein
MLTAVTIRVVIAEDNLLVREGVRRLLDSRPGGTVQVVASCGDLDALLAAVESEQPDVVLTDIRMPPTHTDEGMQVAAQLRKTHPQIGVVLLSRLTRPATRGRFWKKARPDAWAAPFRGCIRDVWCWQCLSHRQCASRGLWSVVSGTE